MSHTRQTRGAEDERWSIEFEEFGVMDGEELDDAAPNPNWYLRENEKLGGLEDSETWCGCITVAVRYAQPLEL